VRKVHRVQQVELEALDLQEVLVRPDLLELREFKEQMDFHK
jgi:hypothetical protein